ncbi:hypothetical protein BAZMOX_02898_1 [methanotrophic endosymbiont of Bathymodiolus azoricus (Menez Gwen)]|nr:hypothetical protein BAZMOX_02898_1 [methanotrophic endosymbiont of Bathymodiolus azoricus (Menez Gwen)]
MIGLGASITKIDSPHGESIVPQCTPLTVIKLRAIEYGAQCFSLLFSAMKAG